MSSPQKVAAKVWGGKPKDYKIIDEETIAEAYVNGVKAERLRIKKEIDNMLALLHKENKTTKNYHDKINNKIRMQSLEELKKRLEKEAKQCGHLLKDHIQEQNTLEDTCIGGKNLSCRCKRFQRFPIPPTTKVVGILGAIL